MGAHQSKGGNRKKGNKVDRTAAIISTAALHAFLSCAAVPTKLSARDVCNIHMTIDTIIMICQIISLSRFFYIKNV
jgi:hypothetical protein